MSLQDDNLFKICNFCNGEGKLLGLDCYYCDGTGELDWVRQVIPKIKLFIDLVNY